MTAPLWPWHQGDPADLVDAEHPGNDALLALIARLHPSWHRDAACRGSSTSLFFPSRGQPLAPSLDLCSTCGVLDQCRAEALADPSLDYGVRTGLTAPQRKALRRVRAT